MHKPQQQLQITRYGVKDAHKRLAMGAIYVWTPHCMFSSSCPGLLLAIGSSAVQWKSRFSFRTKAPQQDCCLLFVAKLVQSGILAIQLSWRHSAAAGVLHRFLIGAERWTNKLLKWKRGEANEKERGHILFELFYRVVVTFPLLYPHWMMRTMISPKTTATTAFNSIEKPGWSANVSVLTLASPPPPNSTACSASPAILEAAEPTNCCYQNKAPWTHTERDDCSTVYSKMFGDRNGAIHWAQVWRFASEKACPMVRRAIDSVSAPSSNKSWEKNSPAKPSSLPFCRRHILSRMVGQCCHCPMTNWRVLTSARKDTDFCIKAR